MATQNPTLSVVINTKNSASTLKSCLQSVKRIADEIIIMDMHSDDDTVHIAKQFSAKVFFHKDVGYVEPARNAAIAKATGEWILILDSDETIPPSLAKAIRDELIVNPTADAYFIPRKNIIFGKWVRTGWWPDHVLRLFRVNLVEWSNEIHSIPRVSGTIERLPEKESLAIVHENYKSVDQYVDRAQKYGHVVANSHSEKQHSLPDPLEHFFAEFLRRYFSWKGYQDGAHGYFLSVLQGVTQVLESAYQWEVQDYTKMGKKPVVSAMLRRMAREARYWELSEKIESSRGVAKFWWKILRWIER